VIEATLSDITSRCLATLMNRETAASLQTETRPSTDLRHFTIFSAVSDGVAVKHLTDARARYKQVEASARASAHWRLHL